MNTLARVTRKRRMRKLHAIAFECSLLAGRSELTRDRSWPVSDPQP